MAPLFQRLARVPGLQRIGRLPVVRDVLVFSQRTGLLASHLKTQVGQGLRWLVRSRERTNFTYPLKALNEAYLATFVSQITGAPAETARQYLDELKSDEALATHIRETIATHPAGRFADETVYYGRRMGWYAVTRILKPAVVVETGIDKGLGACVLCAALLRNRDEGRPGRYFGTDINPRAGYLLTGRYAETGTLLYGDSIASLERLDERIDLFINDSDHSEDYEAREYDVVASKLSERASSWATTPT